MTSSEVHIAALTDDDVMIVQDFLETKTTLLLERDAQISEWRFEYRVMEKDSEASWDRSAIFLDYTFARRRFVRAVLPGEGRAGPQDLISGTVKYADNRSATSRSDRQARWGEAGAPNSRVAGPLCEQVMTEK